MTHLAIKQLFKFHLI